jgi:hyperosmotically inducible protein
VQKTDRLNLQKSTRVPKNQLEGKIMKYARALAFAAVAGITIVTATGCSVARDQQTVGSYVDDAGITTAVKAKMAEDKTVSATSISVETLNGTVQLSGFAKSASEKNQAENIARNTKHVREVRNSIVVRP